MNIYGVSPSFSSPQQVGPQTYASSIPNSAPDSFSPRFRGEKQEPDLPDLSKAAESDLEALKARAEGPLAALFKDITDKDKKK